MEKNLDKVMEKAEVLIEALPYIQKFNRKIIVVKYGGSAMSNEELQKNVIKDVTLLKLVGFKPIIVHGGGKEISKWVAKTGKEAKFVNGLRVTDEETMEIAEMVLGRVNKNLVRMVEELGVKAVGISGKDGKLLTVEKKYSDGQDIGFVGNVTKVSPKIIYDLLENDFLPIISPIGLGEDYETYNINADDAACAVAKAVGADKLVFLDDAIFCIAENIPSSQESLSAERGNTRNARVNAPEGCGNTADGCVNTSADGLVLNPAGKEQWGRSKSARK